jgi:hypothetical protein
MDTTITIRCTDDFVARLDAFVAELARKEPGQRRTRSDALRIAAERTLAALTAKTAKTAR